MDTFIGTAEATPDTDEASPLSPAAVLDAIQRIAPELAQRAGEAEQNRQPPADVFEKLAATGVFRMMRPKDQGGGGFTQAEALPVIEAIARADGSAGWSTMIGVEAASLWMRFADSVPAASSAQHGVLTRCCLMPRGEARQAEGGWHVRGRWPLASGAFDADWFLVNAVVMGKTGPEFTEDGQLHLRTFAVPGHEVAVHDTWHALGMRSTMSHDAACDTVVSTERSAPALGIVDSPHTFGRLPLWLALGPFHCAVVIGIAQAALAEAIELLRTKRPVLNPTILTCEDPLVQSRIGVAATRINASRAFLMAEVEANWATAERREEFTPLMRTRSRSMLAFVHDECMSAVNDLFLLCGTTPLYDGAPLQRQFRDLRTAAQHICASPEIYRPYGALLMGETPPMVTAL